MTPFAISAPGRILFGRGVLEQAASVITAYGTRGILVTGRSTERGDALARLLLPAQVTRLACLGEPTLDMLLDALPQARAFQPDFVVAIGGGAAMDMGKALAALIPQSTGPMDHLEGVGRALPFGAAPLPFIALPTTAGTGAEVTKNAVIGVPDQGRKVSLRDDRMMPRAAIVDPALTDGCPWPVTLASGLDAITQVIEPYVSCRATPFTDAISLPAISQGLTALMRLQAGEVTEARDAIAWVSLSGGLALANSGLGAVHGLAGVIGGLTGGAHGAICGALLGPVLAMNRALATPGTVAHERLTHVCAILASVLGCAEQDAPSILTAWARGAGLPGLGQMGLANGQLRHVAEAAMSASSMKGNPVPAPVSALTTALEQAL